MENVMGVDIGATQMRAGRVANEKVSLMFSEKTPSDGDYDQALKRFFNSWKSYLIMILWPLDWGCPLWLILKMV